MGRNRRLHAAVDTDPPSRTAAWRGSTGAAELRDAWQLAALESGWTRPTDWWVPEVETVAEALTGGGDVLAAAAWLGLARADGGVGIREALDDLCALYAQLPAGGPPLTVVRALVEAWAEAAVSPVRAATCEDPLTGLATAAYLRTRCAEVYREAEADGVPAGDRRALLVVEAAELSLGACWESLLLRLEMGNRLRSVFAAGETLAAAGPASVAGLVRRGEALPRQLAALRRELTAVAGLGGARIWTEPLPATLTAALDLLDSVERAR
jgi:hypothetical protein